MGECFKGWRRKIGCVTLVMACLLLGVWIRGFAIEDVFRLGKGQGITTQGKVLHTFSTSSRNGFVWIKEAAAQQPIVWRAGWRSHPTAESLSFDPENYVGSDFLDWRWQFCGFDFGRHHSRNGDRLSYSRISYLSLVLPLTLLSVCLILSTAPKRESDQIPNIDSN